MPIIDADPDTLTDAVLGASAASSATPHYVVFFASGQPAWCPDCRNALPALESVFGDQQDAPTLHKVLVGERAEWRAPDNRWRGAPFHIDQTPTVVRFVSGKEAQRLGDQDSQSEEKLRKLVHP